MAETGCAPRQAERNTRRAQWFLCSDCAGGLVLRSEELKPHCLAYRDHYDLRPLDEEMRCVVRMHRLRTGPEDSVPKGKATDAA